MIMNPLIDAFIDVIVNVGQDSTPIRIRVCRSPLQLGLDFVDQELIISECRSILTWQHIIGPRHDNVTMKYILGINIYFKDPTFSSRRTPIE